MSKGMSTTEYLRMSHNLRTRSPEKHENFPQSRSVRKPKNKAHVEDLAQIQKINEKQLKNEEKIQYESIGYKIYEHKSKMEEWIVKDESKRMEAKERSE